MLRRVVERPLTFVRRWGKPVVWTPPWMGWGNHALLWFWAWRGLSRGESRRVLRTPAMQPWLELFPAARSLTVDRGDVRLLDQRLAPRAVPPDRAVDPFTVDFTVAEREAFVHEVLLSSTQFGGVVHACGVEPEALVVNVRRGDYYSADHVADFGMNITGWVGAAVAGSLAGAGVPSRVHVVSDDPTWCRQHLGPVIEAVGAERGVEMPVTFPGADRTPASDLATLASASRLVLANSTFSYWGAYISQTRGTDPRQIWAPDFFIRSQNEGRAWLLDPRWQSLSEVEGGWHPGPAELQG